MRRVKLLAADAELLPRRPLLSAWLHHSAARAPIPALRRARQASLAVAMMMETAHLSMPALVMIVEVMTRRCGLRKLWTALLQPRKMVALPSCTFGLTTASQLVAGELLRCRLLDQSASQTQLQVQARGLAAAAQMASCQRWQPPSACSSSCRRRRPEAVLPPLQSCCFVLSALTHSLGAQCEASGTPSLAAAAATALLSAEGARQQRVLKLLSHLGWPDTSLPSTVLTRPLPLRCCAVHQQAAA